MLSCVISVALKLTNPQKKHRSYVFLDEAATIYLPASKEYQPRRSNKVAMMYQHKPGRHSQPKQQFQPDYELQVRTIETDKLAAP